VHIHYPDLIGFFKLFAKRVFQYSVNNFCDKISLKLLFGQSSSHKRITVKLVAGTGCFYTDKKI